MLPEIQRAVFDAVEGREVSAETMTDAIGAIMDGRAGEIEIASLLTALAAKGETPGEIAGAAAAMRARALPIRPKTAGLLDTCGTGGDRMHTFNISTATALVAAAAGVPVAKHGNRSATSRSGSAEVLHALGVNIELDPERVARCIDEVGIGFCFAPRLHLAMKHVGPVRSSLPFRTIFNFLGPLTNPAGAAFQLIGASRAANAEKLANALARLGTQRALVVCGNDQLDEVALWGTTDVFEITGSNIFRREWTAKDFGLPGCSPDDLRIQSPEESAAIVRRVLEGAPGPALDIVLANAAAALLCTGRADTPPAAVAHARAAITTGQAHKKLHHLITWTQSPP